MTYSLINIGDHNFQNIIQELMSSVNFCPPFYSQTALDYYSQRPRDNNIDLRDISFAICWNNKAMIAFIGAIETNSLGINKLLAYEVPALCIENPEGFSRNSSKLFIKQFDKLSKEVDNKIWVRDDLINGNMTVLSKHLLTKGLVCYPYVAQVIDLSLNIPDLRKLVRKRYKTLINNGIANLSPEVISSDKISWELMQEFRNLHILEAGRETRSIDSWKRQMQQIKNNEAFLVIGRENGLLISAGLFTHSNVNSFYQVGASRRNLNIASQFHALMWIAILHSKSLGCRWFELGEQVFENHSTTGSGIPSQKELNISSFKAGFGGQARVSIDIRES